MTSNTSADTFMYHTHTTYVHWMEWTATFKIDQLHKQRFFPLLVYKDPKLIILKLTSFQWTEFINENRYKTRLLLS